MSATLAATLERAPRLSISIRERTWTRLYLPALCDLPFHTMSQCKMASMEKGCKVSRTSTSRNEPLGHLHSCRGAEASTLPGARPHSAVIRTHISRPW